MITLAINSFPVFIQNFVILVIGCCIIFGFMGGFTYLIVKYNPIIGLILTTLALIALIALFLP